MATVGADASSTATTPLITTAGQVLRRHPQFLGRYFKNPQNPDPTQYSGKAENHLLQGLPVLCFARQTARVNGTRIDGTSDAVWNMAAVIEAFGLNYLHGLGYDPLILLDTEPPPANPTLTAEYYTGWSAALRAGEYVPRPHQFTLRFTPGIYLNQGDAGTWTALGAAIAQGATCAGVWVARYDHRTGDEGPPAWDTAHLKPDAPTAMPPCPIIGWQYAGDYQGGPLDFNILEPTSAATTLALMIPPPTAQVWSPAS
jgi:hypothetical protein